VLQRMNVKICNEIYLPLLFIGGTGASGFWFLWHFVLSREICIRNNITLKSYYYDIQALTNFGLITANIIPLFHNTPHFHQIMFPINFNDLLYRIICNMTLSCHEKQQLLQERNFLQKIFQLCGFQQRYKRWVLYHLNYKPYWHIRNMVWFLAWKQITKLLGKIWCLPQVTFLRINSHINNSGMNES
jgi:hypothetical protein